MSRVWRVQVMCEAAMPPPRASFLMSARILCSASPRPPPEVSGPLQGWRETAQALGRSSMQRLSSATRHCWDRYEEFVGLVEVREAQGKVAEAEKDFMVARGIVRGARESVESQLLKLKEVRDRLDRVSRDDVQYLELATLEHKMLQEEKRLRTAYTQAEESEREKFFLFSASVRESHEKERTRAERTKNWSVIGSVLGAIIGVAGSTYINRVRLQELRALLLEAQKGPISLQEAIQEHASIHQSQQRDLAELIVTLGNMVSAGPQRVGGPESGHVIREDTPHAEETRKHLDRLQHDYSSLDENVRSMAADVRSVQSALTARPAHRLLPPADTEAGAALQSVALGLSDTEHRLITHMNRNSLYSTALTCTALALTVPIVYFILRGN